MESSSVVAHRQDSRVVRQVLSCYVFVVCLCCVVMGCAVTEVHCEPPRKGGGGKSNVICFTKQAVFVWARILVDYVGAFEFVIVLRGFVFHKQ